MLWIALLSLLPLNFALAQTQTEADYWRKTELSSEFTGKFISNEKCHSSPAYLESCRAAWRWAHENTGVPFTSESSEFESSLRDLESKLHPSMPVQMFRARLINIHLAAFDAHAALVPSALIEEGFSSEEQDYVGIGVVLEPTAAGVAVREVHPGSPAHLAGLVKDDLVLSIARDGRNFEAVNGQLEKAADLILGKAGDELALRLLRGPQQLELPMKRAEVEIPYVTSDVRDGTGYLRIYSFESYSVCQMVITELVKLRAQKVSKLILDLRGNPGGEKAMAVCVAELFLGPKTVMGSKSISNAIPELNNVMQIDAGEEFAGNEIIWEGGYASRSRYRGDLVVLIDALSASGAEIVAGALQDHQRAWLIGERSFGKGSVQSEEFVPDFPGLTLRWTIERFYQPLGRTNQAVGISPNFEIPRRKDQPESLREADLFPNSLSAESQAWSETRPQEAEQIRNCAGDPGKQEDPKAYAQAVLACM